MHQLPPHCASEGGEMASAGDVYAFNIPSNETPRVLIDEHHKHKGFQCFVLFCATHRAAQHCKHSARHPTSRSTTSVITPSRCQSSDPALNSPLFCLKVTIGAGFIIETVVVSGKVISFS